MQGLMHGEKVLVARNRDRDGS